MTTPATVPKRRATLTPDQAQSFLDRALQDDRDLWYVASFLYETGMRLNDLQSLEVQGSQPRFLAHKMGRECYFTLTPDAAILWSQFQLTKFYLNHGAVRKRWRRMTGTSKYALRITSLMRQASQSQAAGASDGAGRE